MAIVKRITVSVGYTLNAGNYESARYHESMELDIDDEEKPSEVRAEAREFLKKEALAGATEAKHHLQAQR